MCWCIFLYAWHHVRWWVPLCECVSVCVCTVQSIAQCVSIRSYECGCRCFIIANTCNTGAVIIADRCYHCRQMLSLPTDVIIADRCYHCRQMVSLPTDRIIADRCYHCQQMLSLPTDVIIADRCNHCQQMLSLLTPATQGLMKMRSAGTRLWANWTLSWRRCACGIWRVEARLMLVPTDDVSLPSSNFVCTAGHAGWYDVAALWLVTNAKLRTLIYKEELMWSAMSAWWQRWDQWQARNTHQ